MLIVQDVGLLVAIRDSGFSAGMRCGGSLKAPLML